MKPSDCIDVALDFRVIQKPSKDFVFSEMFRGLEDPRIIQWQGRLFLIATVNENASGR